MAAEYGFQALDNPLMLQSDTIRLGLAEMAEMDGCMLCVADQPYCTRESMEALLRAVPGRTPGPDLPAELPGTARQSGDLPPGSLC